MPMRYELFVVPRGDVWQLEIEDDRCQRECLRTFRDMAEALCHGRRIVQQLRETGDVARVHLREADGWCSVVPLSGALTLH
jgi:hypothetical protein